MEIVVSVLFLLAAVWLANGTPTKPNIIFVLADDLGWNDVSWHNPKMKTPTLESLAFSHGVVLNQSYVAQLCSPTRSALLAGYYPYHIGTQHGVFHPMEPTGVPKKFVFFPEHLQRLGYSTHLVGKWHVGYCNQSFVPSGRGFHTFYGYYNGKEDYFKHDRNWTTPKISVNGLDFWDQLTPEFTKAGKYSSEVFASKASEIIRAQDGSSPFFLYLAFQSVHEPLQVPKKYLAGCGQKNKKRRLFCGMVYAMDCAVKQVVKTLKDTGAYDDTVIIFSTDNGGQVYFAGNNYPLRGNKNTLWEGGTRAISFVHSPKHIREPGVRTSLFHIVDWFPTILSLAGKRTESYGDGLNQWEMISLGTKTNKRKGFVYNIYKSGSAIRWWRYKLVFGSAGKPDGWIPPSEVPREPTVGLEGGNRPSKPSQILLFDLLSDPTEHVDLSKKRPLLRKQMMLKLKKLRKSQVNGIHVRESDLRGAPSRHNGTFASSWC